MQWNTAAEFRGEEFVRYVFVKKRREEGSSIARKEGLLADITLGDFKTEKKRPLGLTERRAQSADERASEEQLARHIIWGGGFTTDYLKVDLTADTESYCTKAPFLPGPEAYRLPY